ncbi:MAG: penicillin-binding protein 2, partial [Candidatus Zixiibacteriota bacterium]
MMKNDASKARLVVLFCFVTLAWGLVMLRLVDIQIVRGKEYGQKAARQSTGKRDLQAQRGIIYDRTGREVAINVYRNALYAYPSGRREITAIHRYLDRLFGLKSGISRSKHALSSGRFAWIDRDISDELAARLLRDSVSGLYIRKEVKRDYPFHGIGQQLLGCTDIDGRGISGLEFGYDSVLAGCPGLIDYLRDGQRKTYRIREVPLVKPVPGNSIILTIDWYLQEIVEEELKAAVEKYNALDGTALFMNVHTGEILAAADYTAGGHQDAVKLRAVSDCFEPGSVFKIFTSAVLLEENVVDLNERIYCEQGFWKCGRRTLRDDKKLDSLTFQEIFELSSNIGIAKLAQRLGGEKLRRTALKFGFSQHLYAGLPGEACGAIGNPGKWSPYNIAALAIGH